MLFATTPTVVFYCTAKFNFDFISNYYISYCDISRFVMSPTSISRFPLCFILYGYLIIISALFSKSDYSILRTSLMLHPLLSLNILACGRRVGFIFYGVGMYDMTGRCVFERKIALKRKFEPILLLYGLPDGRFPSAFPAFLSFLSLKTDFGLFLAYFVTIHSIYYIPVISYPQGILSYPQPISKLSTILG